MVPRVRPDAIGPGTASAVGLAAGRGVRGGITSLRSTNKPLMSESLLLGLVVDYCVHENRVGYLGEQIDRGNGLSHLSF